MDIKKLFNVPLCGSKSFETIYIYISILVGHEVVSSIVAWKKHLSLNIRQPLTNKVCKPKKLDTYN